MFCDVMDKVEEFNYNEEEIFNMFGYTLNRLFNYIYNSLKSLYNKTMKVFYRYKTEYVKLKNGSVSECSNIINRMNFLLECEHKNIIEYEDDYRYTPF